jgi:YgiT-type zinc finger domain-containing protein
MEAGLQGTPIMICLICRQAELMDGFTSVTLSHAEMNLLIKNVPARVCPACGEAYVEEDVTANLLHAADETIAQGIQESVREYLPEPDSQGL